jgi:hypothetical protein
MGCSPTTSYLGELLDERRAVMEVKMVMTCSRKGPQTQFTPEFVLRLWGDRKTVAKSTGFLAALSQQVPNKCWTATGWGDHAPAIPTNNVTVDSAAAGGRGPRGGGGSAPTEGDLPTAEKACTGAILIPASALPPGGSRPHRGHSSPWGATRDRGRGCAGRGCLSRWGVSGRFACRHFT